MGYKIILFKHKHAYFEETTRYTGIFNSYHPSSFIFSITLIALFKNRILRWLGFYFILKFRVLTTIVAFILNEIYNILSKKLRIIAIFVFFLSTILVFYNLDVILSLADENNFYKRRGIRVYKEIIESFPIDLILMHILPMHPNQYMQILTDKGISIQPTEFHIFNYLVSFGFLGFILLLKYLYMEARPVLFFIFVTALHYTYFNMPIAIALICYINYNYKINNR